jgi:hypothetical protein
MTNANSLRPTEVICVQCGAEMGYVNGVTFNCRECTEQWAPNWNLVEVVDDLMCEAWITDKGEAVEAVIRAAVDGIPIIPGSDPDQYPTLSDLIDAVGLPDDILLSERLVIAWSHWRHDLDTREETL